MFTEYYILAVGFGVFAVIVSLIGLKNTSESFPGRFYGPLILIGVLFGISTVFFAWKGGEEEVEHREHEKAGEMHEKAGESHEGASSRALPAGIQKSA